MAPLPLSILSTCGDEMLPYLSYVLPAICFIISGILAFRSKEGWGWFLVVGVFLVPAAAAFKMASP